MSKQTNRTMRSQRLAARAGGGTSPRFESAHEQLLAILATVTEQEAADHAGYFSGLGSHYAEHQLELDRLISAR